MAESKFEKRVDITQKEFKKRTIHSGDQFYDITVKQFNDDIDIDVTSSQTTKAHISGREVIEKLIEDLKEALDL